MLAAKKPKHKLRNLYIPEYVYMLNIQCKSQSPETVALLVTSLVPDSPAGFHLLNPVYSQLL